MTPSVTVELFMSLLAHGMNHPIPLLHTRAVIKTIQTTSIIIPSDAPANTNPSSASKCITSYAESVFYYFLLLNFFIYYLSMAEVFFNAFAY